MADNGPALRKRQQIENASKAMFLWVAIAAAVVGIASVLAVSLYGRIAFKQEVINEKNKTVSTLRKNNEVADELKREVRVLNTNQDLLNTPRIDGAEPLSVILDALPSTANSSALGASFQQRLLNVDGVSIDSLTVDPISGLEDGGEGESTSSDENAITFNFTVSAAAGQDAKLQQVLRNLERSVRVINVKAVSIEQQGQDGKITLSVEGEAYFQPAIKVELKEVSKRP